MLRPMVPEAKIEQTDAGLVPAGEGWFVLNARDAGWREAAGRGHILTFTGWTDEECERLFPLVGINLSVLGPGDTLGMYHREAEQEGFLVLAGEPLLLIEGRERRLEQWDFVHCPPDTEHIILGAGDTACVVLAVGSRLKLGRDDWGMYTVDDVALKHNVGVEQETNDPAIAYTRFPPRVPVAYRDGWLPG